MQEKSQILDKFIYFVFLALTIIAPLIFTTQTAEVFEVPKMYFVYTASTLLFFATLLKFVSEKQIKIPTNIVVNTFSVFLIIMAISTITSTDKFTSIYGYPTRLNGGLLSQFAYFVIFITALVSLKAAQAKRLVEAVVFAAVAVSLWGIPSYFDKDPTCLVLIGKLTSSCWQVDFNPTLRIFSTLGQPNWLASYLILALPIAVYKAISEKTKSVKNLFITSTIIIFLALVLTNSLSGILGFAISAALLFIFLGKKFIQDNIKIISILSITLIVLGLVFSGKLTSRIKDTLTAAKNTPPAQNQQAPPAQTKQSPTSGGTDSGQIRLIVWRGALNIFKNWPVLGSGPETFVNTYYLYRPNAHNKTTEWQFFYNKAHNEFLNYLANTGALGFIAYIAFLISILYLFLKSRDKTLLATAAAMVGYQATIFFGFSTVATATTFTILTAAGIVASRNKTKTYKLKFLNSKASQIFVAAIILVLGLYTLTFVLRFYFASVQEKRAQSLGGLEGLVAYKNAITIFPAKNPYLLSDFAYNTAVQLSLLESQTNREALSKEVETSVNSAQHTAPNNYIVSQRTAKSYLLLLDLNPNYKDQALTLGQKLISLAPTYPDSYITLAKIQITSGQKESAQKTIRQALELKPDDVEAQELLQQLTIAN